MKLKKNFGSQLEPFALCGMDVRDEIFEFKINIVICIGTYICDIRHLTNFLRL